MLKLKSVSLLYILCYNDERLINKSLKERRAADSHEGYKSCPGRIPIRDSDNNK